MKFGFKVKALVAGAMMMAGGVASANTTIDTTGGDIFLSLWDQTNGTTYVFDTGLSQSGTTVFSGTGSYSFTLTGDANYTAFNAGVAAGDVVTYNLIAVGTAGAYSTSGTAPTPKNGGLNQALSFGTNYATGVNGVNSGGPSNSAYVNSANQAASGWGTTDASWTNQLKVSPSANAAVGTALNFYSVAFNGTNHTSNFINATVAQFASTWLLNGGTLSYGAVPIPAPFGLLLGGLALMGVIARRKPGSADQDLGGAAA